MSFTPTTPTKPGVDHPDSSSVLPSSDHQLSTSSRHSGAPPEPSPASTYGDTAAGDSVPATPLEGDELHQTSAVRDSLRLVSIADTSTPGFDTPSSAKHPLHGLSRVDDSDRPKVVFPATNRTISQDRVLLSHHEKAGTNNERATSTAENTQPGHGQDIAADQGRRWTHGGVAAPPGTHQDRSSNFVVQGITTDIDDPFTSPKRQDATEQTEQATPSHKKQLSPLSPARFTGEQHDEVLAPSSTIFRFEQKQEPSRSRPALAANAAQTNGTNHAHAYQQIGFGSPSPRRGVAAIASPRYNDEGHAIYLGNLPPDLTQQDLLQVFGKYGPILSAQVISRTSPDSRKQNVFAFVDFVNQESCQMAVEYEAGNLSIRGFNVRVEHKVLSDCVRRNGQSVHRTVRNDYSGSPNGRLAFPQSMLQSTFQPLQPQFNMTGQLLIPTQHLTDAQQTAIYPGAARLGYYAGVPSSAYTTAPHGGELSNHNNIAPAEGDSAGNAVSSGSTFSHGVDQSTSLYSSIQPQVVNSTLQPSVALPFATGEQQRQLESADRIGWQLAYDRYLCEHPQTATSSWPTWVQYGSSTINGGLYSTAPYPTYGVENASYAPASGSNAISRDYNGAHGEPAASR
ncbi:U2 snRNP-associated SURP domain-containing protein [Cryomyces antarcticus]|uniref:U2 snRNP-associated SURP domain-containing protein n=1 Tax=Cryomyces antarcticus TaxID=329879 RepID=A0ABR0LZ23_9PEZI|nr:U2 snRNP-associated SURP domain-containing protein [Cryomyces antarcticus]